MPIELFCKVCGSKYIRPPSRKGKSKYCGKACQMEALRQLAQRRVGKKHQNYKARTKVLCDFCGKSFLKYAAGVRKHNYCSRRCMGKHMPIVNGFTLTGSKHPAWKGGQGNYRGPNWNTQRRTALERDGYTCQECGKEARIVHHIRPFQLFEDFKKANDLKNLKSLCGKCHGKLEKVFWETYTGPVEDGPYKSPYVACKKCGKPFNGRDGAATRTGILRYCPACRVIKPCETCGGSMDLTGKRYPLEARFCSRKCRDIGFTGVPKKYRGQLPNEVTNVLQEVE